MNAKVNTPGVRHYDLNKKLKEINAEIDYTFIEGRTKMLWWIVAIRPEVMEPIVLTPICTDFLVLEKEAEKLLQASKTHE